MACDVWFYHLERSRLETVLPELLEKTLARGWKAVVRSPLPERLEHLDGLLWTWRDDAFLAHGLASEPNAERQPILLSGDETLAKGAQALFLIDGAEAGDLAGLERCILIFDGGDEEAVERARGQWQAFKGAGHDVAYWRQSPTKG
ncbi:MAG TPA: DNA polymerase III subunit chi, partial [Caulobacteraceae bacterium]